MNPVNWNHVRDFIVRDVDSISLWRLYPVYRQLQHRLPKNRRLERFDPLHDYKIRLSAEKLYLIQPLIGV